MLVLSMQLLENIVEDMNIIELSKNKFLDNLDVKEKIYCIIDKNEIYKKSLREVSFYRTIFSR